MQAAGRLFNAVVMKDVYGRPVILFRNEFSLRQVQADSGAKLGPLLPYALPPETGSGR